MLEDSDRTVLEAQLLPSAAEPIPARLSLAGLRDQTGAVTRLVAIAHDITEQKEAHDALARANTLKDAFLANTSHELRTPLNGIIGLGESLLDGVGGPLRPAQRQNLAMIVSSGRRLTNLINDILDYSKLRHRTLGLQLKPVDLCAITDLVLALTRPLVARKAVEVVNRIDPDVPLVHGDEDRLQQILYNLVGNGIKFTAEGRVEVTAEVVGAELALTVTDTGIGIPAEKFETVFESFEQGEGSESREYGGTGLGLAITRQLVELQGGTISVASDVGRGSRFRFTVPVSDVPRGDLPEPGPDAQLSRVRFLPMTCSPVPRRWKTTRRRRRDRLAVTFAS